jgi:8-oxo-dGTP pyrophosphatase MutT (NUDIX family)
MMEGMFQKEDLTLRIRKILNHRTLRLIEDKEALFSHAAVLIPIFRDREAYGILFTKRSDKVEAHKGQISFPGGRVDEGDASLLDTALRETQEEIGLPREIIEVLGRTDDARTMSSNYVVHPFVGLIPYPYPFTLSSHEVEKLIQVPLSLFFAPEKFIPVEYEGRTYQGLAYAYDGEVIWGATARIMQNLVEILLSSAGSKLQRGVT